MWYSETMKTFTKTGNNTWSMPVNGGHIAITKLGRKFVARFVSPHLIRHLREFDNLKSAVSAYGGQALHGGKRIGAGRKAGPQYVNISIRLAKTHKDRMRQLGLKAKEVFMAGLGQTAAWIDIKTKQPERDQRCLFIVDDPNGYYKAIHGVAYVGEYLGYNLFNVFKTRLIASHWLPMDVLPITPREE